MQQTDLTDTCINTGTIRIVKEEEGRGNFNSINGIFGNLNDFFESTRMKVYLFELGIFTRTIHLHLFDISFVTYFGRR